MKKVTGDIMRFNYANLVRCVTWSSTCSKSGVCSIQCTNCFFNPDKLGGAGIECGIWRINAVRFTIGDDFFQREELG